MPWDGNASCECRLNLPSTYPMSVSPNQNKIEFFFFVFTKHVLEEPQLFITFSEKYNRTSPKWAVDMLVNLNYPKEYWK